MTLAIESRDAHCLVSVEREMTIYTTAALLDDFMPLMADPRALLIDLSLVSEMDTAGLQLLLALKRHKRDALRILAPSPAVLSALDTVRLAPMFGLAGHHSEEPAR